MADGTNPLCPRPAQRSTRLPDPHVGPKRPPCGPEPSRDLKRSLGIPCETSRPGHRPPQLTPRSETARAGRVRQCDRPRWAPAEVPRLRRGTATQIRPFRRRVEPGNASPIHAVDPPAARRATYRCDELSSESRLESERTRPSRLGSSAVVVADAAIAERAAARHARHCHPPSGALGRVSPVLLPPDGRSHHQVDASRVRPATRHLAVVHVLERGEPPVF